MKRLIHSHYLPGIQSMKRLIHSHYLPGIQSMKRLIHSHYLPGIQSMALDQDRRILFLFRRTQQKLHSFRFRGGNEISSVLSEYKPSSIVLHSSRGRFFIAIGSTTKSFDYTGVETEFFVCRFPFLTERKRKPTSFTSPLSNLLFYDETVYTLNQKGDILFLDLKDVRKVSEKQVRIFGEFTSVAISLLQ
ncbi:uncharacterized protein [Haliotis asinina]|uniref:uncharacterized protein n=1 Tax=Haliotis asinina TaxID=109174 RepID=UPI0035327ECF